jgi:hypothetical protein
MNLQLHKLARQDLFDGEEFYEQQEPGLGNYFSEALEVDLERLLHLHSHDQFIYTPKERHGHFVIRSLKFPWSIYYRCENDRLLVSAVLDQRFSPTRIQQILRTRQPS